MAGHKKHCEKCGQHLTQNIGYMGIKPNKFPRYKWVCSKCSTELGGDSKTREWLLPRFQAEGLKADKI